jgi:hypothetical protein
MRRFLSSLMSGGGALAIIAFFLPWVTVSCNGARVMSVSPYERAVGSARPELNDGSTLDFDVELSPEVSESAAPTQTPESGYWALLIAPIILLAAGALFHLGAFAGSQAPGAVAVAASAVGVVTTTVVGLQDHLGMSVPEAQIPAIVLIIDVDVGAWISLAAYVLAASGGVAALVLRQRVDRPQWS